MANEIVSNLPLSAEDENKMVNVTIKMDATVHQKIKLYATLCNCSIQVYVTNLIENDLKHNEFGDRNIPVQPPIKENKKTLIFRMKKEMHQKLRLLTTMFETSLQQYITFLILEDLKKNKMI